MKTLTPIAISKLIILFASTIDHAVYTLDGTEYDIHIFKKKITEDTIRIFVFLDDSIEGSITGVKLIDCDGDVIAKAEREFIKPYYKGLYAIFKYRFVEVEEEFHEA